MSLPKKTVVVNSQPDRRRQGWSAGPDVLARSKRKRLWTRQGPENTVVTVGPAGWLKDL